jgi:hypothetical protein
MAKEDDVTEYVNAIKDNALYLIKQKPEPDKIAAMLKQRVISLSMGNTSDQVLVDIAAGMIAYKVIVNKKNKAL